MENFIEVLKLAHKMLESRTNLVCYVDVCNLPKMKAEKYVRDVKEVLTGNGTDRTIKFFIPKRGGEGEWKLGTELVGIPQDYTLEEVFEISDKIWEYLVQKCD